MNAISGHDAELEHAASRWARTRPDRWAPVPAELDAAIAADLPLAVAARRARARMIRDVASRIGTGDRWADVLLDVPRERFVLPEELARAADDAPSPLDPHGNATVSAPHAYVLTYALLDLGPGDHLLELGTGTGYGAAIASRIVGRHGRVTSIEVDPALAERAARLLGEPALHGPARVVLLTGDAADLALPILSQSSAGPLRVAVTYAVAGAPLALLDALPLGAVLVAPVGDEAQVLTRWVRAGAGLLHQTLHGAVRYVAERR
jgi:protein-L-isoaspartate(D-aspartate) O-methyltransferase